MQWLGARRRHAVFVGRRFRAARELQPRRGQQAAGLRGAGRASGRGAGQQRAARRVDSVADAAGCRRGRRLLSVPCATLEPQPRGHVARTWRLDRGRKHVVVAPPAAAAVPPCRQRREPPALTCASLQLAEAVDERLARVLAARRCAQQARGVRQERRHVC
eukprot:366130-Chlamydomonas_euryale.AAC.50